MSMECTAALAISFDVSLPPKKLWPNKAKGHSWKWNLLDRQRYYKEVYYSARQLFPYPTFVQARISYDVYWPKGQRRLDEDNLIAAMKTAQDAVRDALLVSDSPRFLTLGAITHHRLTIIYGGYIRITVERE